MTGGNAALTDDITADGQNGVSFIHPMGEIFLPPLAGETNARTIERKRRIDSKINFTKGCGKVPMEKPKERILLHTWAYKHVYMHECISVFL